MYLLNICSSLISTRLPAPVFGRGTPFLFFPLPCLLSLVRLASTSFPLVSAVFVLFCAFWDGFDGSWITLIKVHIILISIDRFGFVCGAGIYLSFPPCHPFHKFFIFCPQSFVCPWLDPEITVNNEHIGDIWWYGPRYWMSRCFTWNPASGWSSNHPGPRSDFPNHWNLLYGCLQLIPEQISSNLFFMFWWIFLSLVVSQWIIS